MGCTATFLLTLAIGAPHSRAAVPQYLANMALLGEFPGARPIDGGYWSLFVEIRFYAMVALVLAFRRIEQAPTTMAVWLVVCAAIEVLGFGRIGFLLVANDAADFVAGATFYLIWSKGLSPARAALIAASRAFAVSRSVRAAQPSG